MTATAEHEAFERLLAQFDFERVALVMKLVGWRWASFGRSPSADDLRAAVRRNFSILLGDPEATSIFSCGMRLSRDGGDGAKCLRLEFILEDWEEAVTGR